MNAPALGALRLQLYAPPPPDPPGVAVHGGLKLDWHSEVGRTGVLLDWHPALQDVDDGMATEVARVIATGLCAVATVAGCTLDVPATVGPDWTPVPAGHAQRFAGRRRLGFGPHPLGLVASRDVQRVTRLFDDDTFAWANESQLLLLAPPGALPRVDRAVVEACFEVPIRATLLQLTAAGVTGLVRAGVDGDVAGLYMFDPVGRQHVVRALAEATAAAGGRWEECDGATFWPAAPSTSAGARPLGG